MLWVALHLPALSLETFAATLPRAADTPAPPLALVQAHRMAAVDAAAAACGVQPGMKRATALALAPTLVLGAADARRDAQALRSVADVALAFTPAVTPLAGPDDPDDDGGGAAHGVLLEVQASLRYFGGLPRLLQRLGDDLAPLGHRVRLACAPTALGAAVLARWPATVSPAGPPPDGLTGLRRRLDDAPVWLLGPGRAHWEALQGMGLATLADLRRLPRSGLARRFGPGLLNALDRARGEAPDPREPIRPAPHFDHRLELALRADTHDALQPAVRHLLAALAAWLRARQVRVVRCTLDLHHERRRRADDPLPPSRLDLAPAQPTADAGHLGTLLAERLARLTWPAPVTEVSLHCREVVADTAPTGELFPTREQAQEGLTRLVERLQARLGETGVQTVQRRADHRPERASAAQPAAPAAATAPRPAPAPARITRPVWRIDPPQPLIESRTGPLFDGRPLRLLAGPERIETGWWDGALATRDYFVAQTADGTLLWLYRLRQAPDDAAESGWFLQGRFA